MIYHFLLFIVCIVLFSLALYIGYRLGRRDEVEEQDTKAILFKIDEL